MIGHNVWERKRGEIEREKEREDRERGERQK